MRKVLYTLVCIVAVLAAVGSSLSLLTDTPSKYLKFLDFPRLQFFWAAVASVPLFVVLTRHWRWYDKLLVFGLVASAGIQAYYLVNYTPIVGTDLPDVQASTPEDDRFSILLANVMMSNRKAAPLLTLISRERPDIIIGMETDAWWDEQLQPVQEQYPYSREVINDVAYGMVLYSRFPLGDVAVRYLQNDRVPSMEATVTLPSGKTFELHAVHPVPPTDFQQLPDNEGQSEKAFLLIGDLVEESTLPVVVAGDFNDVAWSRTDRMTGTEDLLHDVRVGRGIYTSFDAQKRLMRWPLDHVIATDHFAVGRIAKLEDIGSDHFPILVEMALER